jgi:FkbM family methyltransferase
MAVISPRRVPGYRRARDTYNRLFRADVYEGRQRLARLFSEFVSTGDLVFDVGANRGEYAQIFEQLGAQVVAIEPNGELLADLAARAPKAVIVRAALAAVPGVGELFVGAGDGDSTLSTRYARLLREEHELTAVPVRVTTMDDLAAEYGEPDFVKIDVEGHEPEVLAGMSFEPAALSFEFHGALLDELDSCLHRLRGYEFRVSVGNSYDWAGPWLDASETEALARRLAARDPMLFADVYARKL